MANIKRNNRKETYGSLRRGCRVKFGQVFALCGKILYTLCLYLLFMGRSNRSRYDIIADILEAAMDGARKTRIMHIANVNYHSFRRYFRILLDEGLITEIRDIGGGALYKTTEAGIEHLKMFRRLSRRLNFSREG